MKKKQEMFVKEYEIRVFGRLNSQKYFNIMGYGKSFSPVRYTT